MSYCRWSSDHGECDVYVYESVYDCWTIHVAGRKLKHTLPDEIRNMPEGTSDEWLAKMQAETKWRESLDCDEFMVNVMNSDGTTQPKLMRTPKDSEYIDLKEISEFGGETFSEPTPGACADRLEEIRASGLRVPQCVIDVLRAEQADLDAKDD